MKNISLKLLLTLLSLVSCLTIATAQKLPGIQKVSVHAPANIKIDGKATEWKNKMQAYNRAVQASYTVANDDKRLYLVVQADKREIINKIINGGVSFSISKTDKKSTDSAVTITYPVFGRKDRPMINFANLSAALADEKNQIKRDSVMLISNNSLEEKVKMIRVNGVPEVDTLISVYNLEGVKARSAFDDRLVYTVEISIDLKLLRTAVSNLKDFNYNIRLNALQTDDIPGIDIERDDNGTITSMNITKEVAQIYYGAAQSATDCWGKYSLVK